MVAEGGGENGETESWVSVTEQNSDNKRYDKGTSEGGKHKDGGLQEDTAKDSSSQEVELDTYLRWWTKRR